MAMIEVHLIETTSWVSDIIELIALYKKHSAAESQFS